MMRCKLFISLVCFLTIVDFVNAKLPQHTISDEIAVGSVIEVALGKLKPTQSVIAYEQVNYKLALYSSSRQALFSDLCKNAGWGSKVEFTDQSIPNKPASYTCLNEGKKKRKKDKLKTVVLGHNNELYLTDGHHTFSTFHDMPYGGPELIVTVLVEAKIALPTSNAFWAKMAEEGKAWLYDATGAKIDHKAMPNTVGRSSLNNDPYRAAAYFLRDGVWAKPKPAVAFVEFYWAQYIREQATNNHKELLFPGYTTALEYTQWLERIHDHLTDLNKDALIYAQFSAQDMGWTGDKSFKDFASLLCKQSTIEQNKHISFGRLGTALMQRGIAVNCDK